MASELLVRYSTGATVYAIVLNGAQRAWNGSAFEAIAAANWSTYAIAMTEQAMTEQAGAGIYLGDMPAASAGLYCVIFFLRAGTQPAITDYDLAAGQIHWTGTAEAVPSTLTQADVRTAAGLATASLDTQLAAIGSKTANLPTDPADQSAVESAIAAAQAAIQGADADTLKSLSDQLDSVALEANAQEHVADALEAYDPPTKSEMDAGQASIRSSLDTISAKTSLITGSGNVTLVSPVSLDGQTLTLTWGDDYTVTAGQSLTWEDTGDSWPTWITDEDTVVTLTVRDALTGELVGSATGTVTTGEEHTLLRFELAKAITRLLTIGLNSCKFDVVAESVAGEEVTLVIGTINVRERQNR